MSRKTRKQANARPWLQRRDSDDADEVMALLEDPDEHLRARAWEQHEAEKQGAKT